MYCRAKSSESNCLDCKLLSEGVWQIFCGIRRLERVRGQAILVCCHLMGIIGPGHENDFKWFTTLAKAVFGLITAEDVGSIACWCFRRSAVADQWESTLTDSKGCFLTLLRSCRVSCPLRGNGQGQKPPGAVRSVTYKSFSLVGYGSTSCCVRAHSVPPRPSLLSLSRYSTYSLWSQWRPLHP